jgi:hypothetical protein
MGSTCTAYGPSTTNGDADLICRFFLESAIAGASFGRALLEARLRFVQEVNPLNPVELKTLAQFVLLGDPSLRATGTVPKGSPKAKSMAMARAARTHTLHRGSLTAKAATLGKGVDSVAAAPIGAPPPVVRAALDKAARQEGFVPVKKAQTYAVQQAPDPVFRAALAKKAFTPVRYHMMMAKPAPAAPAPVGATVARVRSDVRAKGKSRAEAPRPKTVHANLLLLAREVGGKVMEVERLYTKARRKR